MGITFKKKRAISADRNGSTLGVKKHFDKWDGFWNYRC